MTLAKEIESLKKEAEQKLAEAVRLEKLQEAFPDLERWEGRWKKVVFCSASVTTKVTSYETRYNCGCCNDSSFELWPYLETPLGRVYSKPARFVIGERSAAYDVPVPSLNWKEGLRGAGIPEALLDQVEAFFQKKRAEARDTLERALEERPDEPDPLL